MKRLVLISIILLPQHFCAQSWYPREDTYWFAGVGLDLRNATFGGTVNDAAFDGIFSLGYRNAGFSIIAYYETFPAIEYPSLGVNPGFLLRPGKKFTPVADLSLSLISRPWKVYPSLALNVRMEYHFDRFFVYVRGENRWRTDYDFYQISVYGGFCFKFGFLK